MHDGVRRPTPPRRRKKKIRAAHSTRIRSAFEAHRSTFEPQSRAYPDVRAFSIRVALRDRRSALDRTP
jgi:hypothetical protein